MHNEPKKLDSSMLRRLFRYDPVTGELFWKERPSRSRIDISNSAGTLLKSGYVMVRINKEGWMAHRVAWSIVKGFSPVEFIDHINGNKSDNRIENLREANRSQNGQNKYSATSRNKTSRFLGVSFFKKCNKFRATININGKNKHLGTFDSEELAHQEYLKQKKIHHVSQSIELDSLGVAA